MRLAELGELTYQVRTYAYSGWCMSKFSKPNQFGRVLSKLIFILNFAIDIILNFAIDI